MTVSVYFFVMGLTGAVWATRIPAVKQQTHLTNGLLGVALFAGPVGLIIGTTFAGRLGDRFGTASIARIGGIGCCGLLVMLGLARNLPELMAALLVVCVFTAMFDVGSNAQGVRVETAYGRPVFTSLHALYSLGGILGALAGAAFAWASVGLLSSLAAAGVPGAVVIAIAGRWLLANDRGTAKPAKPSPADEGSVSAADRGRTRRLVLMLGVMAVCGLISEGAAGDWSGIYLRYNLRTSAGFAALGFTAFSLGMTVGRLAGDRLAARFGATWLVRGCGLLAALGLAIGLASRNPAGGLIGFATLGVGLSCVVPQVFAAGGRADPVRPASGLAWVVGLGYAGLTSGPVLIGALASVIGLPLALGVPVLLALWIAASAGLLNSPQLALSRPSSDTPTAAAADSPVRQT